MVHEALSRAADLGDQHVMLLDALRHQRGKRSHRSFDPFGRCVPPVLEKPRRDPRQRRQMIYGVAAVIHRVAQDNAEFSGEGCRTEKTLLKGIADAHRLEEYGVDYAVLAGGAIAGARTAFVGGTRGSDPSAGRSAGTEDSTCASLAVPSTAEPPSKTLAAPKPFTTPDLGRAGSEGRLRGSADVSRLAAFVSGLPHRRMRAVRRCRHCRNAPRRKSK
jgi:hypothetical protein